MAKKEKLKRVNCKKCGESWMPDEVPTNKEWTKLAPMPDSEGRLTVMIMATWNCPSCGKSAMGLKGKFKDEGPTGPSKQELIIEKINSIDSKISLSELASELSFSEENLEKALQAFINRKTISGKIENGYFIKL
ncbi:MAG TPA: PCI domain-containing protein [Candidatus Bathyarchaeia archaeon]|nr:PCI domain-containing protein [Candidatus Bathyarchaeia archaeon]